MQQKCQKLTLCRLGSNLKTELGSGIYGGISNTVLLIVICDSYRGFFSYIAYVCMFACKSFRLKQKWTGWTICVSFICDKLNHYYYSYQRNKYCLFLRELYYSFGISTWPVATKHTQKKPSSLHPFTAQLSLAEESNISIMSFLLVSLAC